MGALIVVATYHAKLAHLAQTAKQNTLNPVKKACSAASRANHAFFMAGFFLTYTPSFLRWSMAQRAEGCMPYLSVALAFRSVFETGLNTPRAACRLLWFAADRKPYMHSRQGRVSDTILWADTSANVHPLRPSHILFGYVRL